MRLLRRQKGGGNHYEGIHEINFGVGRFLDIYMMAIYEMHILTLPFTFLSEDLTE